MDRSSFNQDFVVAPSTRAKTRQPAKKGRWREIEAIQDQKRLQEELQQYGCTLDLEELAAELEL
ncbi:DUF3545 domain-containing protein [Oceanisphaera profunda]|uniref:DUF3545 domain-containing protein n=1 Tax=Oceanisphaera profunda TaxID=1416627 RepID=A0A1Y0D7Y3_9GAMM|nr:MULTISPECIES: DUF3545 family protein [Oceanisphaera]ART83317.1 DUF3545 domain-containing protein [Oceanisphaera profunda]